FGGGTAELQLIESDDPLEAGLEILSRPPGKKPQTMTLLSGSFRLATAWFFAASICICAFSATKEVAWFKAL
ncbi:hypothetical protein ACC739_37430, partial [Rhizobium ruizarguesonis]